MEEVSISAEEFSVSMVRFTQEEVKFAATDPDPVPPEPDPGESCLVIGVTKSDSVPPKVVKTNSNINARLRPVRARSRRPLPFQKRLCLVCMYEACPEETSIFPQDILGAVNCTSFQKELQAFFIMSQLLDIPSGWIQNQVKKNGKGTLLQEWFSLCQNCFTSICRGWDLYQTLLSVRSQLKNVKEKLQQKIKDSTKRHKGRVENELVKEIRRYCRSGRTPKWPRQGDDADRYMLGGMRVKVKEETNEFPPLPSGDCFVGPLQCLTESDRLVENKKATSEADRDVDNRPSKFPAGGMDTDHDWEMPSSKKSPKRQWKRKRKVTQTKEKDKAMTAAPKRKGLRDRSPLEKKKRIWKKKPRKWPWHCDLCPTKYKEEAELAAHKELHERNKRSSTNFDCNFCKFPCEDLEDLRNHKYKKHLRSSNSRMVNYGCKSCPFTVQYYYLLEEHVRKEHPDLPEEECGLIPLLCKVCNKEAANINSAILHKKLMHPEITGAQPEESLFECEECGEKFNNAIRLKYRQNAHIRHTKDEARYTCETCGKGLKWQSRLRQHAIAHNVERQWICSLCGLDFTFKNALVRHNRHYHPDANQEFGLSGKAVGGEQEMIPDFKCPVCGLTMSPALRRRHLKVHQESFTYKCNLCDRSYLKMPALKRHQLINHSNGEHNAKCEYCNKTFLHVDYVKCHYKYCRVKNMTEAPVSVIAGESTVKNSEQQNQQPEEMLRSSPVNVASSHKTESEAEIGKVEAVEVFQTSFE